MNVPVAPSIEGQVIAFVFVIVTETAFEFYPVYNASQLKIVEALNYE